MVKKTTKTSKLNLSGSPTSRLAKALPLRIGPPWAEVAIMTIVCCVNRERFTASDIVEQFKLHEWVKREPNTVAVFAREIGPTPDGLGLDCRGDEVLPCRENAVKALEAFGFKLHEPPARETYTEKLLCYAYGLPNLEALYARIADVPTLAESDEGRPA